MNEKPDPPRALLFLYRFLFALLLLQAALIAGFTLYAAIRPNKSQPLFALGTTRRVERQRPAETTVSGEAGNDTAVFNGIGRLRIPVAAYSSGGSAGGGADGGATLVISIAFPYPPDDGPFTEELASHIGDFRGIASDYFSSLPAEKTVSIDEAAAKTEILKRFNSVLRLGKIGVLYFNDLMVIE